MSRFVRPDTHRIEISDGDWLLVKKRLTAGETRRIFARMLRPDVTVGEGFKLDPMQVGRSQAVEYLLDWSFSEMKIRDQSPEAIGAALDAIDMESYNEIIAAIGAHEQRMELERMAEKNAPGGKTNSTPISPSAA